MTDEGIQGFPDRKGMPGFTAQEIKHKMSLRASVTSALFFDNVRVPDSEPPAEREGPEGSARLPHAGALRHHLGPDRRRHRLPREARIRQGPHPVRPPAAANQAVQLKLADMARRITTWRSCCRCSSAA
jgi:glutaryl-CoA dehydrogenase